MRLFLMSHLWNQCILDLEQTVEPHDSSLHGFIMMYEDTFRAVH